MNVRENSIEIVNGYFEFDYINSIGYIEPASFNTTDPRSQYEGLINFNCNNNCSFKIGMIPKQRGIFILYPFGGNFYKSSELEASCPPINQFRNNFFDVQDYNMELYKKTSIKGSIRLKTSISSITRDVVNNTSAYIFEQ